MPVSPRRPGAGVAAVILAAVIVIAVVASLVGAGEQGPVQARSSGRSRPAALGRLRGSEGTRAQDTGRATVPAAVPSTAQPVSSAHRSSKANGSRTRRDRGRIVARIEFHGSGWIATLRRPTAYAARAGGRVVGHVAARNPFGQVTALAIVGDPLSSGWAQVELPIRPNGSTGWVRWRDVILSRTGYWVKVDLASHLVTVGNGRHVVLRSTATTGEAATPTPAGRTYVWESVRPDDQTGPYGPYVLGLAMFSDAYATFNGGDAQIGIHGTDEPSVLGESASHGCVRVANAVITRLIRLLPLGTPVTIG
jgi:lipoprotein-anchoring transpeptidase ErfK/SrfK